MIANYRTQYQIHLERGMLLDNIINQKEYISYSPEKNLNNQQILKCFSRKIILGYEVESLSVVEEGDTCKSKLVSFSSSPVESFSREGDLVSFRNFEDLEVVEEGAMYPTSGLIPSNIIVSSET